MRKALARRRYSENGSFQHLGINYRMQVGFHDDASIGEVFLGMEKAAGTPMDVNARDIGILISLLLQHGLSPKDMAKSITRDENNEAEGLAGAVLEMLAAYEPKWVKGDVQAAAPSAEPSTHPGITKSNARQFGYTGDECPSCNAFTMVRNGTCLKCDTCGGTTGCS